MEKINIAELLKDCPQGMELDCTMFENVSFRGIQNGTSQIMIHTPDGIKFLNSYGCYHDAYSAKCVIFPKGKNTWEGFVPPCKFKDGDVISNGLYIAIFHKTDKPENCVNSNVVYYHCFFNFKYDEFKAKIDYGIGIIGEYKYATEKEKVKLFKVIKDNGYKWNAETKTLEKLIKPKFKEGDKIRQKNQPEVCLVSEVRDNHYLLGEKDIALPFFAQDDWELVPNKFDITTLKPFEKVLVRDNDEQFWTADFFVFHGKTLYPFMCVGHYTNQCIPYEGNEHLLGTTDDCDEYYKTWE